jgi:hypothetical protein
MSFFSEALHNTEQIYIVKFEFTVFVRFEIFIAVDFQVSVFWVVVPYGVAVGCHHFGGLCYQYLQG